MSAAARDVPAGSCPPPYTAYRCRIFHTLAEADDSCAFYTEAVPFADDEVGDNAELPVEAGA